MGLGADRIIQQPDLDTRPHLVDQDLRQAVGEWVHAPDEVLEMN